MNYIKRIAAQLATLWEARIQRAYFIIALVLGLSLFAVMSGSYLKLSALVAMLTLTLLTYVLAKRYACPFAYSLLANLMLVFLGMNMAATTAAVNISILLLPLLPLGLYLLNPLWLYNLISGSLFIVMLVFLDIRLPAYGQMPEDSGLMLYFYALVWFVLLGAEFCARREKARQPASMHYNAESEVINPQALERVLEISVANAIRYRHSLVLAMFEFTTISASEQSLIAAGSDSERRLLSSVVANIRRGDTLGKWRGNSFALIVPDNNRAGAELLLQKLRRIIAASRIPGLTTVDFRFGLVALQHESHTELLKLARQALQANMRQQRVEGL